MPRLRFRPLAIVVIAALGLLHPTASQAFEKEIEQLSRDMAESIAAVKKSTLAVVDFTDLEGKVTPLGRFLAEEFSVRLADAGQGFQIIDRTHLASVLSEQNLSALIDPSTAQALGRITTVEALVTGNVTPFGNTIRISVKILDTETARVIGAARASISRTEQLNKLVEIPDRQTQVVDSFEFTLQGCRADGDKVVCGLIVTNQAADRTLTFSDASRAFDQSGNEYPPSEIRLGQKRGSYVFNQLVSGIRVRGEISFSRVPQDSRVLTLLEFDSRSPKPFKVRFRDVPVVR